MNLILLLIDIGILLGAALWIYNKQDVGFRQLFWPALVIKIVAGFSVGVLYFYHYGQGDTISYWQDGQEVARLIRLSPGEALGFYWEESAYPQMVATLSQQAPRSLFFVKIAGVLALLTGGNYYMMSVILSFLSFLGAWYLFQSLVHSFPSKRNAAAVAFLFYPSVVFWSSGLIKESLGLGALFFLAGICLNVERSRKLSIPAWLMVIVSVWVGWNLKYYWLGIFLPVVVTTILILIAKKWKPAIVKREVIIWLVFFLVLLLSATSIHPNFYPSRFTEVIYQSNHEFMQLTDPGGAAHFDNLEPTFLSIMFYAPSALVAGLFRPFIWEAANFLSVLAGIENLVLLTIVLLAFPALRKVHESPHRLLILAVVIYIALLAIFLALSTPNFGTLSRYKIGVVPFLLFVSLIGETIPGRWIARSM